MAESSISRYSKTERHRICPRCGEPVIRIRRNSLGRLLSLFGRVRRYRCSSAGCGWSGNLSKQPPHFLADTSPRKDRAASRRTKNVHTFPDEPMTTPCSICNGRGEILRYRDLPGFWKKLLGAVEKVSETCSACGGTGRSPGGEPDAPAGQTPTHLDATLTAPSSPSKK